MGSPDLRGVLQASKLNQSAADKYQSMKGRDIPTVFLWLSVIMGASARVLDEVAAEGAFTTEMPDFGECPPFRQIHNCRFPLFPGCQDCPGIPFPCDEKWISVDGPKCYYVSTIDPPRYDALNFDAARLDCEKLGGTLATIADEAENERIYDHVGQGYDSVWIGLYQTENTDDAPWQWVNGQNTTFFNWEEGEPNNDNGLGGSEDCGHMNNDNGSGTTSTATTPVVTSARHTKSNNR